MEYPWKAYGKCWACGRFGDMTDHVCPGLSDSSGSPSTPAPAAPPSKNSAGTAAKSTSKPE
jgi:hypothetical protein